MIADPIQTTVILHQKTRTQNMHMLCTRNFGELVLGELQGVIIKIHVMQLRVVNYEVL